MKNNKSLGQHWLKDRAILEDIADLAASAPYGLSERYSLGQTASSVRSESPYGAEAAKAVNSTLCLEIGPGLGTLTSSLLKRFQKVLAIEFDKNLAANLPKSFPGTNLTVINQDILKFDLSTIKEPYVVAGNIPYYITSPIITHLLTAKNHPERIVLLIQKEVAERILAGPGHHTLLSLMTQNLAEVEPGFIVPRAYFTPPPKVDSATIVLVPRKKPKVTEKAINLAKVGFRSPRKMLIKNLPYPKESLEKAFIKLNIPITARPSDLTLENWEELAKIF